MRGQQMATIEEQIKALEEEIFNTQKNKATEHHLGKIKAKIAKLRAQQELQKIKGGGGGRRYYIKKSGDATVALVGFPSVGKSSLLNYLTGSKSEVIFKPLPQDDPKQRRPDITQARDKLGWDVTVPLREGLGMTIDYFRGVVACD